MKIETQPLEDHQVKLTVEVEPEPFDEAKRRAARQIAKKTKIPGFRPGKAPYNVILRHVGEEALVEEGLEILIKDLYPKIIEEAGIEPYGPGRLDNLANLDPLTLEFVVPLMAEVELGDYRSIQISYELKEVTQEDVDEVIDNLRRRQAVEEPVDRPAQAGDRVYFKLSGRRLEVPEGEDATLVQERSTSAVIEDEDDDFSDEWPFPGFSRQLIGLSAGDERTLNYAFPEDSDYESLRGQSAEFNVNVEQVKSIQLPELNDEFAQSVSDQYESVQALRNEVRSGLEQQTREAYNAEYDEQLISQVVEGSTVKYPPQMLESEIDEVLHQLEHRLKAQNLDLETYLKTRDMEPEGLREEARPVAESRLKRSLVLLEIAQAEGIEVDPEELQSETERTLEAMTRFMSETEMRKISTRELIPNLVSNILADMRINRTLERLRSIARGEEPQAEEQVEAEGAPETQASEQAAPAAKSEHPEVSAPEPESEVAGEEANAESEPASPEGDDQEEEPPAESLPSISSGEAPGE